MKLTNICTGGTFECSDEQGNRLLAEGGYTNADVPAVDDQAKAPVKRAPRKATGAH